MSLRASISREENTMTTRLSSEELKGEFTEPQCTGDDIYECTWYLPTLAHIRAARIPDSIEDLGIQGKEITLGGSRYLIVGGSFVQMFSDSSADLFLQKIDDPRLFEDYLTEVLKTENLDFVGMKERLQSDDLLRIAHSICGIANEAGELMEALKKHIFYGAPLDTQNILEEFGDLMWFMGPALDVLGSSYEEVQKMNILKLRARYKKGTWSKEEAANRDKLNEQLAMRDGTSR